MLLLYYKNCTKDGKHLCNGNMRIFVSYDELPITFKKVVDALEYGSRFIQDEGDRFAIYSYEPIPDHVTGL